MSEKDDPVEVYQDAYATLEKAKADAQQMASRVRDGADKLSRWERTTVTGVNISVSGSIPSRSESTFKGAEWPDASAIAKTLKAYHDAYDALELAWHNVPAARRIGFQDPPPRDASSPRLR